MFLVAATHVVLAIAPAPGGVLQHYHGIHASDSRICAGDSKAGRTYGRHYAGERVNTSRYAGEHGNIEPGAAGPYHRAALADVARERPRLALRIVLQRLALQRGL